jgi:hypothetical protein
VKANGLDERFNQTLQNMLVKFVCEKKEMWEDFLSTCTYAYNTSRHESSKFTPFEVMFARKAVIPVDLALSKQTPLVQQCDEEMFNELQEKHRKILEVVKENIVVAQKRQKEQYDLKHANPSVFSVGAIVLVKDFRREGL